MVWSTIDQEADPDDGAPAYGEAPEAPAGADDGGSGVVPRAGHPGHGGLPGHGPHAGDQTRARILSVALELIADRGFAATSTREIAERLGFTKAALYYHFRTKDDLLAAIVGTVMSELEALIEGGGAEETSGGRRHLVEAYVDLVARHAELIRVLSNDPSVKESAGLHEAMPLFRQLIPLLAGTPDPDTAQRTRVRAALSAVHGAILFAQPDDPADVLRKTAIEVACAALGLPATSRKARG